MTRAAVLATVLGVATSICHPAWASAAPEDSANTETTQPQKCVADIPRVRHLVLFAEGTSQEAARSEVSAACGSISGYYPEIAVAVATSADSTFADRIGRERAYSAQAEALTGAEPPDSAPRPVGVQAISDNAAPGPAEPGDIDRTGEQWDMAMIGADRVRARQSGSPQVLVGVLDSGVDADHPELAAAVDRTASAGCVTGVPDTRPQAWQPTGEHGTHVAGIIAAADDGVGVTGVAPGVRIASVKVVDATGFIYPEAAVCGFVWAARAGMRVTNNSYFVDPWLFTCPDRPGQAVVHEALRRAVGYATQQGVLGVAAAGNEGVDLAGKRSDATGCEVLPAQLPDVLAVSAVGAAKVKSSYSSYGLGVIDVAAPGGDIRQRASGASSGCVLSTVPGGYRRMCGTSMATPHVAGVAALVASAHPEADPRQLTELIKSTATPLACPRGGYDPDSDGTPDAICSAQSSGNGFYGAGLVNADAASAG